MSEIVNSEVRIILLYCTHEEVKLILANGAKNGLNTSNYLWIVTKACSRLVFGRVTRRTRLPRVIGSCENVPGYTDTRYIANCAKKEG